MHNPPTSDLESIARSGSRFKRMAVRIPTYLMDVRENPAWLPMFLLARTLLFRRMHWRLTKRRVASGTTGETMFTGINCDAIADALRAEGYLLD